MARSFSNAKNISSFVANEISTVFSRRGYSGRAQTAVSSSVKNGAPNVMLKNGSEEASKTTWVPDPETGFYRPDNQRKELDPVELRAMLIKNRNTGN